VTVTCSSRLAADARRRRRRRARAHLMVGEW